LLSTNACPHAGTAKATSLMVKIGMLNLVRDIVASLSQQGRADVVAQVAYCTFGHITGRTGT